MTVRRLRWLGTGPLVAVVGSTGKSAAQDAFDAGFTSAPTAAALMTYLAGLSGSGGSAVEPTHGIAVGGETTILAPAAVPANSPWWVSVYWNGALQRPGVNFTSDGTRSIHLNFTLMTGDDWIVDQRQRSLV